MLYFWVIPVLLLAILAIVYLYNRESRRAGGTSRLERAGRETGRRDLP